MSFLDSIGPFFPELSKLSETYPTNYHSATRALRAFNAIEEKIEQIYHQFKNRVSIQNEKNYQKNLDEQMKTLGEQLQTLKARLKNTEKTFAKPFLKQQKLILNEIANYDFGKENSKEANS